MSVKLKIILKMRIFNFFNKLPRIKWRRIFVFYVGKINSWIYMNVDKIWFYPI